MNRWLVTFILLPVCIAVPAWAENPVRTIDLNTPGILEALKEKNPAHYQAVEKILANVAHVPDLAVKRWLQVEFNAKDAQYGYAILTSYPPKKDLSFRLDDTRYRARIVLVDAKPKVIPAR